MVNALWKEGQKVRSKIHAYLGLTMSFEGTWAIFGPESKYWRWWWCKSKENRKTKWYLNWSRDILWVKNGMIFTVPLLPYNKELVGHAGSCVPHESIDSAIWEPFTAGCKHKQRLIHEIYDCDEIWWSVLVNENFSNFGNVKTFVLFCFCFFF